MSHVLVLVSLSQQELADAHAVCDSVLMYVPTCVCVGDRVPYAGPGDRQGGGRPGGGGQGVREPRVRVRVAGGLFPGAWRCVIAKEEGDRAGEGGE